MALSLLLNVQRFTWGDLELSGSSFHMRSIDRDRQRHITLFYLLARIHSLHHNLIIQALFTTATEALHHHASMLTH